MADFPKKLSSTTAKHAAAIFYGKPVDFINKGSAEGIESQGTITFISYKGLCFGVTNEHVAENYDGPNKDRVYYIALRKHVPLPGRLLFKSTKDKPDLPFDIAVFLLDEAAIINGGKIPILIDKRYGQLKEGDMGFAVGFPGVERRRKNSIQMAHGIYHIVAKCISSSDRLIILYEKLAPSLDRIVKFGGISGGSIYRVESEDDYTLTGIIFQGRGHHEEANKDPNDGIWIWGFPIGPDLFDKAFKIYNLSEKELKLEKFSTKINFDVFS